MNAQELVELRKQGSITQAEFFIGLNSLRRQNSQRHLQQPGRSGADPAESAVDYSAADGGVVEDSDDIIGRGEVGSTSRSAAASPTATVERPSTVEQLLKAPHQNAPSRSDITSSKSSACGDSRVGGARTPPPRVKGPPPSGGAEQQCRRGHCEEEVVRHRPPCRESASHSLSPESKPQGERQLSAIDDAVENNQPQEKLQSRRRADGQNHDNEKVGQGGVVSHGDCDSEWLFSPSGERTQQSTSDRRRSRMKSPKSQQRRQVYRKTPENGKGHSGGDDNPKTREAGFLPSRSCDDGITEVVAAANPHWRPAGDELFRPQWPKGERLLSRSQPGTPSRSHDGNTYEVDNTDGDGKGCSKARSESRSPQERREHVHNVMTTARSKDGRAAEAVTSRYHHRSYNCLKGNSTHGPDSYRTPQQQFRQQAYGEMQTSSPSKAAAAAAARATAALRGNQASAIPIRRRRRGHSTEHQSKNIISPVAISSEGRVSSKTVPLEVGHRGDDESVGRGRAALEDSANCLWRTRGRHRESHKGSPPARRCEGSRRRPSNSVASSDSNRYYTASVRCDRYGYPLHERECLGSSGATGGGSHFFSPMIKGLPDFYESRPRRRRSQGHDDKTFDKSVGSLGQVGAGQPSPPPSPPLSLYERTTDWQARASKIRARKLAEREEKDMSVCTFQPNLRPHADSSDGAPRITGYIGSRTRFEPPQDGGGSGGVCDETSGGSGGGCGGRAEGNGLDGEGNPADSNVRDEGQRGKRLSGVQRAESSVPSQRRSVLSTGTAVSQRLYDETKRLDERRFEGRERKRMGEEEIYARTCTFEPSLAQTSARNLRASSRYKDSVTPGRAASAPPATTGRGKFGQEATFHPKILGVQPGMTRARDYVSLDVTERLFRSRSNNKTYQLPASARAGYSAGYSNVEGGLPPDRRYDASTRKEGEPSADSRSECQRGSWDRSRRYRSEESSEFNGGRTRERTAAAAAAVAETEAAGLDRKEFYSPRNANSVFYRRPRSAPAARAEGRSNNGRPAESYWADRDGRGQDGEGSREGEVQREDDGGRGQARANSAHGQAAGWVSGRSSRESSGVSVVGRGLRRQNSISFREFLVRQARSQTAAKQHLNRLTAQQSPSFTPQLSKGTLRMVARNRAAVTAGGGRFEERLTMADRRRSRDRKAAVVAARKLERQTCTFTPQLTPRARDARCRSARELSLGDSVLRAAKMRMARAREDIRLLENPNSDGTMADCCFEPTLETAGDDGLAPLALSRLRLADELDTYLDRVQEAASYREEQLFRQKQQQQAAEDRSCTFQPKMTSRCPDLVKRTAAGMRCIREFRRQEALRSGEPIPSAKPGWRYN